MRPLLLAICTLLGIAMSGATALAAELPRTVIALYDTKIEGRLHSSGVHRYAAMPLNHLGLIAEFHDLRQPLPDLAKRPDVRGVVFWRPGNTFPATDQPERELEYIEAAVTAGKHVVVLGGLPTATAAGRSVSPLRLAQVQRSLGWRETGEWQSVTFDAKVLAKVPGLVEFERRLPDVLPPFDLITPIEPQAITPLVLQGGGGQKSHPVIIGQKATLVSRDFVQFVDPDSAKVKWYINPFELFRLAFRTDDLPKPDTTTLTGRRIYYSHVDGDGWLSRTQIKAHLAEKLSTADVLKRFAIEPYPDLTVSVAPLAAELDPEWQGTEASQATARAIFALPQVEAASHSYSHPFQWSFFEAYSPDKEQPFLKQNNLFRLKNLNAGHVDGQMEYSDAERSLNKGYGKPRAYMNKPFALDHELGGSLDLIARYAPPDRPPRLIQWPGDNVIFAGAIAAVKARRFFAINGGDTRFDNEFPSVSYVAAIGFPTPGGPRIYASASNENTYTSLWTERFYGLGFVTETWRRTETPRRLKPMNLYYHTYSGERIASLNAVIKALDTARASEIIPVFTSEYAAIAEGFFSARIDRLSPRRFRILDRGALQTIRFDQAEKLAVDFNSSQGVIGARVHQGSLYVALDPLAEVPELALSEPTATEPPTRPILVQSRWAISDVRHESRRTMFKARGFGEGQMQWQMPTKGQWEILVTERGAGNRIMAETDPTGLLSFVIAQPESAAHSRDLHVELLKAER